VSGSGDVLAKTLGEDLEVTRVQAVPRVDLSLRADLHVAGDEDLRGRVSLQHRSAVGAQGAEDVASTGQDQLTMARRRTSDLDVAVDAGRKGTLGTGGDRHGRSSAAIREWIGHATCRSQIRDQRALEGHAGPAPGRGAIDGRREEEPCTLGSSAHRDHVGCQGGEWTVDRVVSAQPAVIHPDIAARDLEPARADATVRKEDIARKVAARTGGMHGAGRPSDTAEQKNRSDEATLFHRRFLNVAA
jgi:hypothetical protein